MILLGKIYYDNYEHNSYINAMQKKKYDDKNVQFKKIKCFFSGRVISRTYKSPHGGYKNPHRGDLKH